MGLMAALVIALAACKDKEAPGSSKTEASSAAAASAKAGAAPADQAPAANPQPAAPVAAQGTVPATQPAPAGGQAAKPGAEGNMDFSVPLKAISSPSLHFPNYKGKKTLIFYFGPSCPHCQHALPEVQKFAESLKARGVQAVAIANSRSNPAEIQEFIMKFSCRLPVLWDSERKFGEAYGVKVLPTLYVVGEDGRYFKNDGFDGPPTLAQLGSRF
jgi:peroxiredoxin